MMVQIFFNMIDMMMNSATFISIPPVLLTMCLIDQVHHLMRSSPQTAGQESCLPACDLLNAGSLFVADFMPFSPLC